MTHEPLDKQKSPEPINSTVNDTTIENLRHPTSLQSPQTMHLRAIGNMTAQRMPADGMDQASPTTDVRAMGNEAIQERDIYDFSDVRVHKESVSAVKLGALAYTQGDDIHFAPGQYKPHTNEGKMIINHELGHVIQQRQGFVRPTRTIHGTPVNDNHILESEAARLGVTCSGLPQFAANELMIDRQLPTMAKPQQNLRQKRKRSIHTVQRVTFRSSTGKWVRYNGGNYVWEAGPKDAKQYALHMIGDEIGRRARAIMRDVGPHVAVMIAHKTMYVAVNNTWARKGEPARGTPIDSDQLAALAKELINEIKSGTQTGWALDWVKKVTKIYAFGTDTLPHDTNRDIYHGEMRIMNYIKGNKALLHSKPTWPQGQGLSKALRIGGTLDDCSDCHYAHTGWACPGISIPMIPQGFFPHDWDPVLSGYTMLTPGVTSSQAQMWRYPLGTEVPKIMNVT